MSSVQLNKKHEHLRNHKQLQMQHHESKMKYELEEMSRCFVEQCDRRQMTLSQEEGQAIANRIYPDGAVRFHGDLDYDKSKLLLVHARTVRAGAEMIGNILKLGKFAFLAVSIVKGSVNPLAGIYFVMKQIASWAQNGSNMWLAVNGIGSFMVRQMQVCVSGGGMCHTNTGVLDCYDLPSESRHVIPVGDEDFVEDDPDNWGTCDAGTCVSKNGHCADDLRPICVDGFPNYCVCGLVVNPGHHECFMDGLLQKSPTLGTALG